MSGKERREILDAVEAAAYLKVNDRTVRTWASRGIIPGIKLGSEWRFYLDDLENLPHQKVQ